MSSPPDTLLIDGVDLRTGFAGVTVIGDMNLWAPGGVKGQDDDLPGADGLLPASGLPLAAYLWPVPVKIEGATRGARNANMLALAAACRGVAFDNRVTLTRRLATADDSGYFESTCNGRFDSGLSMATWNPFTGRCDLQFKNLDGGWTKSSDHSLMPA